eukprot:3234138-Ditylum_brightwellii.AAC.1
MLRSVMRGGGGAEIASVPSTEAARRSMSRRRSGRAVQPVFEAAVSCFTVAQRVMVDSREVAAVAREWEMSVMGDVLGFVG